MTTTPTTDALLVERAASTAAATLPSVSALRPGESRPGDRLDLEGLEGAVLCQVAVSPTSRIGVLLGRQLRDALSASPALGALLAAAVQPTLDAVAAVLGTNADMGADLGVAEAVETLGHGWTALPLLGDGVEAVLVVSDELLTPRSRQPESPFDPATAHVPAAATLPRARRGIELLHGVDMELTVELGRARMAVRDLLALSPGDVLELDRAAGSPADLLVNGRLIARGEVVVVNENFGLRITEILEAEGA